MKETPPHLELVSGLVNVMAKYSKETNKQVTGQCTVEVPNAKDPPMLVMYFCNEVGNYMVWFADAGKFHLYLHIDGDTKRVASLLVTDFAKLQQHIDEIRPQLMPQLKPKRKRK